MVQVPREHMLSVGRSPVLLDTFSRGDKIWYFDHIITADWVSVQCYEAQQKYNNVSLSFKAWWSHHSLSIASGTELKHMKCAQMLDWHHKHPPPPHTVCLISQNKEESVQHVAFSAWWCQSFQGFSGSLYKHVCSEEEIKQNETKCSSNGNAHCAF